MSGARMPPSEQRMNARDQISRLDYTSVSFRSSTVLHLVDVLRSFPWHLQSTSSKACLSQLKALGLKTRIAKIKNPHREVRWTPASTAPQVAHLVQHRLNKTSSRLFLSQTSMPHTLALMSCKGGSSLALCGWHRTWGGAALPRRRSALDWCSRGRYTGS